MKDIEAREVWMSNLLPEEGPRGADDELADLRADRERVRQRGRAG